MNAPPVERHTFLWQGLLIVLPALLLAAFGLLSLRQDRILAEHEAAKQAAQIADDLARVRLPQALLPGPLPLTALSDPFSAPKRPDYDPVLVLGRGKAPWTACLVTGEVELAYPPPARQLPPPAPLDPGALEKEQRTRWNVVEALDAARPDLGAAAAACRLFLETSPPEPFAALTRYRLGVLLEKQGAAEQAREQFESVLRDFPSAAGESGVPLSLYARLQLLRLEPASSALSIQAFEQVHSVCSEAILDHPMLIEPLLDRIDALRAPAQPVASRWRFVAETHTRARSLHSIYRRTLIARTAEGAKPKPGTLWINDSAGQSWLVLPRELGGQQWLLAISEADLRRCVAETLREHSLPTHFGVGIEACGRLLTSKSQRTPALAASEWSMSTGSDAFDFRVSVRLTDPAGLHARQRARTVWFGALIALSAIAVLIGFVASWRAFQKQRELSEMKSNFVSSVSHELRAPIASVRLMAEELNARGVEDTGRQHTYHQFIVQECRRLSALIENVLDFARHEQGRKQYEFEPTDLVALVQETVRLMRVYGAEKQVGLTPVIRGAPAELELDGRAIQQVLVNLIDNAIKHSPHGATVTVGLEFPPAASATPAPQPSSALGWLRSVASRSHGKLADSSVVTLWVEDCGEGIPKEELDRIFERFYRLGSEQRRATQGVGLGLAIVKYVTAAHGGRVTVSSEPGRGSRFTVELPVRISA